MTPLEQLKQRLSAITKSTDQYARISLFRDDASLILAELESREWIMPTDKKMAEHIKARSTIMMDGNAWPDQYVTGFCHGFEWYHDWLKELIKEKK